MQWIVALAAAGFATGLPLLNQPHKVVNINNRDLPLGPGPQIPHLPAGVGHGPEVNINSRSESVPVNEKETLGAWAYELIKRDESVPVNTTATEHARPSIGHDSVSGKDFLTINGKWFWLLKKRDTLTVLPAGSNPISTFPGVNINARSENAQWFWSEQECHDEGYQYIPLVADASFGVCSSAPWPAAKRDTVTVLPDGVAPVTTFPGVNINARSENAQWFWSEQECHDEGYQYIPLVADASFGVCSSAAWP